MTRAVSLPVLLLGALLGTVTAADAQHRLDPEQWIEMRKMLREKGPAPAIEEDVTALAGGGARRAGPRLIDRGPEVLPAVHTALLAPGTTPRHALALLQVMGALADARSVPVVLELLRRDPASPLRRDAMLVLAMLPATDDAAAFVGGVAADEKEVWRTRRMAYTWYGLRRDPRGRAPAQSLRRDPDPVRQAAALYVLARLGDTSTLEPIGRLLAGNAPRESRDVLLLALAEVAAPEEFERRAPAALAQSRVYKDALRYARFRAAARGKRRALCLEMIRSRVPGHLSVAVRCLLDDGHADALRPYAAVDLEAPGRAALVRNEIRRAGWRIIDTDTEFRIERGR